MVVKKTLPKMLVVDDREELREGTRRLFRRKFDVTTAESVPLAMEHLEVQDFAVIISDLEMIPGPSGLDFYQAIQEHHPHMVDRFILFTGSPEAGKGKVPRVVSKGDVLEELTKAVAELV